MKDSNTEVAELRAQITGLRLAVATLVAPLMASASGREHSIQSLEQVRAMSVASRDPMKREMDDFFRNVLDQIRKLPASPR